MIMIKITYGDFPGGPVAKTNVGGVGSIPSQRSRSHMRQLNQKKKDPACHMPKLRSRRVK